MSIKCEWAIPPVLINKLNKKGYLTFSSKSLGDKTIFKLSLNDQKLTETHALLDIKISWAQDRLGNILAYETYSKLNKTDFTWMSFKVKVKMLKTSLNPEELKNLEYFASRQAQRQEEAALKGESAKFIPRWGFIAPGKKNVLTLVPDFSTVVAEKKRDGSFNGKFHYRVKDISGISSILWQGAEGPVVEESELPADVTSDDADELLDEIAGSQPTTQVVNAPAVPMTVANAPQPSGVPFQI